MQALSDAFEEAASKHRHEADLVNAALQDLAEPLARFEIAWGNRLPSMIDSYVPVVVAAGGKPEEAADHLVTTKVLRKAEGRYDLSDEDIDDLERTLNQFWADLGGKDEETGWRSLIARERRRKRRDT
jgi:hypothetical protein